VKHNINAAPENERKYAIAEIASLTTSHTKPMLSDSKNVLIKVTTIALSVNAE
jgi:hypothetical protein